MKKYYYKITDPTLQTYTESHEDHYNLPQPNCIAESDTKLTVYEQVEQEQTDPETGETSMVMVDVPVPIALCVWDGDAPRKATAEELQAQVDAQALAELNRIAYLTTTYGDYVQILADLLAEYALEIPITSAEVKSAIASARKNGKLTDKQNIAMAGCDTIFNSLAPIKDDIPAIWALIQSQE